MSDNFLDKLENNANEFCKEIGCKYYNEEYEECEGIGECKLEQFGKWYYKKAYAKGEY